MKANKYITKFRGEEHVDALKEAIGEEEFERIYSESRGKVNTFYKVAP